MGTKLENLKLVLTSPKERTVEPKVKGEFLKKISVNGFSIEERGDELTLRPRGMESTAEITIREVAPDDWKVKSASGHYAGFARGQKRKYFEQYINQWTLEALLRAEG